ncbi:MAG: 4Fe-4S binding protein [Candidatus Omnitrophica bacterium]|nr:4Fe-4S binding protein [Candidatus Omnitrophota bacterium]MCM8808243.1 4Fe-4S binding protein [Candidatus Omnitrophota bacterium]
MKELKLNEKIFLKTEGYPSENRIKKGPVAIIECIEDIPCNPCETICKFGAIKVGYPITNIPKLDEDKCTGCGRCIPICPGLAIFVLNYNFSEKECSLTIPYEFLPLPKEGEKVKCLDRNGKYICDGRILKVVLPERNNMTSIITFSFPKKYYNKVRSFKK